jgi:pilus assembly protein TadC
MTLFEELKEILPFIIPLFLIELILIVVAIVDLVRRENVWGDNKIVWVLIIVLLGIIGPIIYFLLGRKEKREDDSD